MFCAAESETGLSMSELSLGATAESHVKNVTGREHLFHNSLLLVHTMDEKCFIQKCPALLAKCNCPIYLYSFVVCCRT